MANCVLGKVDSGLIVGGDGVMASCSSGNARTVGYNRRRKQGITSPPTNPRHLQFEGLH